MRGVGSAVWRQLQDHAQDMGAQHLRDISRTPARRADEFCVSAAGLHLDYSRQRVGADTLALLEKLAEVSGIEQARERMFTGEIVNTTEQRAVLHTALRAQADADIRVQGHNVVPDVHTVLERMRTFATAVHTGTYVSSTGQMFTDVVNIGIGGSDLGPVMVSGALRAHASTSLRAHFISNVDPTDAFEVLSALDPRTTLVLIASKTFTTAETMANAEQVRTWLIRGLPHGADASVHLVALSTAVDQAAALGIPSERVFGFWDWVGGRYSVASAIGLSVMLAVGCEAFDGLLAGMRDMDQHFRSATGRENLPLMLGLLGVWNRNFLNIPTLAVLPYEQYLHRFPAYLQQLTMESNGKNVTSDGAAVGVQTAPVLWGEPGTNGQHSFHQLIHQGTEEIAADIIVFATSAHDVNDQHTTLVANALAQAEVMAYGRTAQQLRDAGVPETLVTHKLMPGNRPCTLLSAELLTPHTLGALIAAYEHAVFTQATVWGINAFDQWGVEYGKEVATSLVPVLLGEADGANLDRLTYASAARLKRSRG